MYEAHVFTREEEKALLQQWFDTVQFDVEDAGIPALDPEVDDEEPQSRSVDPVPVEDLSTVDFEKLMTELRKRDPENPF
jgi:hypothetical protein